MGVYKFKAGPSYKLKTGPPSFVFFCSLLFLWACLEAQKVSHCVKCSVFAKLVRMSKWGFRKENCLFCFCLFRVGEIETEKKKSKQNGKGKKPYKNRFSLRWSSKHVKNKKWIFSKNWLTLFVSGREKKRAFSCTLSVFVNFFGPKQCKPGNATKIVVSAEIAQNKKWHLFLKKVFLTWLKNWVLLTVFLKSCVFWKHYFYSVFSKTQLFKKQKLHVEKNRKSMKNSGLFLNMAFLGVVFWGFTVIVVSFWCVWHSSKSVKCLVSQFWGLLWGGLFLFIWVWKV